MSRAKGLQPSGLARALGERADVRVVVGVGPETFHRESVLRTVAEKVLGDTESTGMVVLSGASTSTDVDQETLARFFDETRTGSLFGGRKVVALRAADGLVSRHRIAFLAWLADPGRAAVTVILARDLPPTVRAAAQTAGLVVTCGTTRGRGDEHPGRFVARRAEERGKQFARPQAELLVELLGRDLQTLDSAVEVLSLHAGDRDRITDEDIDALFTSAREGSVWAFGDRLLEGDVAAALHEAERCFVDGVPERRGSARVLRGETPVAHRLVSAFATVACRALSVREQLDAGTPRESVTVSGGSSPWMRDGALRAARRRPRRAFEALVVYAEETDRGLKSGGPGGRVAVARLAAAVAMIS